MPYYNEVSIYTRDIIFTFRWQLINDVLSKWVLQIQQWQTQHASYAELLNIYKLIMYDLK